MEYIKYTYMPDSYGWVLGFKEIHFLGEKKERTALVPLRYTLPNEDERCSKSVACLDFNIIALLDWSGVKILGWPNLFKLRHLYLSNSLLE